MIKQTIVLSSSYKEAEVLKSLASFGDTSFNTRYFSTLELARYLLQLSGKVIKQRFIKNDDLSAILYHEVKKIPYFEKLSYNDILGLVDSVNDLRRYIVDHEADVVYEKLPRDKFVNKNDAIIEFYDLMMDVLESNNYIDEVGTIRYAYENISSFPNIDFVIYEGDKLLEYGLDMALINNAKGGTVVPTKLDEGDIKIDSYTKAFSQVNEIEDILNYIYKNNIPFDQCLIASAETNDYSNILINYRDLLKFPLTIGVGQNIIETNPGRLFSIVIDYLENNYHTDYLKKIIYDECFDIERFKKDLLIPESFDEMNKGLDYHRQVSLDSILTSIGDLKLTFDDPNGNNDKLDKYTSLLERYSKEGIEKESIKRRLLELPFINSYKEMINRGLSEFMEKYSRVVDPITDQNGLDKILKGLFYEEEFRIPFVDMVKTIFLQNVGKRAPQPGTLYFTSISNASSCLRKHLFVTGLSSNNYPGKRKEDPIILDRDYEAFGVRDASNREIENNKNAFFNLIKLANKKDVNIHLSYAFYNSTSLKTQNASSVIFETYKLENGKDKTIKDLEEEYKNNKDKFRTIEYFSSDILPISNIGRELMNNNKVKYADPKEKEEDKIITMPLKVLNKALSASDIECFAQCPYQFYLSRVLKIPQPEEIDIFELIPANEYGTLAHSLLESLDKNKTSLDEFLKECGQRFDDYFVMHYTDNIPLKNKEKEEFLKMMANAYEMEENTKGIREKEIYTEYEDSGIKLHGFPDKVMMTSTGEGFIVDYKTGRKVKHNLADPKSLIQCIVYSYLVEKGRGIPVTGFEFRYLRSKDRVGFVSNPDKKAVCYLILDAIIKEIKNSYDTGVFTPDTSACKHCYNKDICMKRK